MMRFLHWSTHFFFFFFCITVQTHVLLSIGGTKRLTSTKPSFPPRGLKTRMSHLPWGACFYRPVTLDPFLPWDLQICPSRGWKKKKSGKGNKEDLYWEWCSWTAGASSDRKNFYHHVDIKSCERGTLFHRNGGEMWRGEGEAFYFWAVRHF